MKQKDLLLIGGAVAAYFFVIKPAQDAGKSLADAIGGFLGGGQNIPQTVQQAAQQAQQATKQAIRNAQKGTMETGAGLLGTAFGAAYNPILGQGNLSQNQSLSSLFNTYITGGVMTTAGTANAIVLNPNMDLTQRQAVQSAITGATINAGYGVASRINWGSQPNPSLPGYTPPVGGGVITNYSGLAPGAPTANLASLFATGRIG